MGRAVNIQAPQRKSNLNKSMVVVVTSLLLGFIYSEAQLAIYGYKKAMSKQVKAYNKVKLISLSKEAAISDLYNKLTKQEKGKTTIATKIRRDVTGYMKSINEYMPVSDSSYVYYLQKAVEIKNIALLSFKTFYSKLIVILMTLPLFLMTGCVGLIDGLSRREKRTAELGRESSYVFHRLSGLVIKGVSILVISWLVLPISISPSYLFLSASLTLMMSVSMASSRFKKYL